MGKATDAERRAKEAKRKEKRAEKKAMALKESIGYANVKVANEQVRT